MNKTFGRRLKTLRVKMNMKQEDVASRFGISKSAVGMYERGERSPAKELLQHFAEYFDVSVDYLLGISNYPESIDESAHRLKDLKQFLGQSNIMFKGKMLTDADKQRIYDVLTALFWEETKKSRP